jgi:hypothetical protein
VDAEGLMGGTNIEAIAAVRNATSRHLTAAGGITTRQEIDQLHALGIDARRWWEWPSSHRRARPRARRRTFPLDSVQSGHAKPVCRRCALGPRRPGWCFPWAVAASGVKLSM